MTTLEEVFLKIGEEDEGEEEESGDERGWSDCDLARATFVCFVAKTVTYSSS